MRWILLVGVLSGCSLLTGAFNTICGDGFIQDGEQCDDGGDAPGDGCDASCRSECGNGVIDPGEQCDDGNTLEDDGCRGDCTLEQCGDNILGAGEECDDGNLVSGDGCSSSCTSESAICGNGVVEAGEACDDDNTSSGDGCDAQCQIEPNVCGNGVVEAGEACDDDNSFDADSCRSDCTTTCGDGSAEEEFCRGGELLVPVGVGVVSLDVVDLDGDDPIDLSIVTTNGDNLQRLTNQNGTSFSLLATLPLSGVPQYLVNDAARSFVTTPDAINFVAHTSSTVGLIGFSPLPSAGARGLSLVDINDTGGADLITALSGTNLLAIAFENAGGFPANAAVIPSTPVVTPISVLAVDVDLKTGPDLIVAGENTGLGGVVALFLNDGSGTFPVVGTPLSGALLFSDPRAIVSADFNGDDLPDLAISSRGNVAAQNFVAIFLRLAACPVAASCFAAPQVRLIDGDPRALAVADLNTDGLADLIVASNTPSPNGSQIAILFGQGAPGLAAPQFFDATSQAGQSSILAADMNQDGVLDIVVNDALSGNVAILFNGH